MATTHPIGVADMAKRFSDVVRDDPAAKQVCFRQFGSVSEIWLIIDAPDLGHVRSIVHVSGHRPRSTRHYSAGVRARTKTGISRVVFAW